MRVLLSIKPNYAYLILNGKKKYEFRKSLPKNPSIKTIVIYATMPVGKVIGEFDIDKIISEKPSDLWKITEKFAGISKDFFDSYFGERNTAHAIGVKNARQYDAPLDLDAVLGHSTAPQSFCYL
jgi:predicted transcriptional regulator